MDPEKARFILESLLNGLGGKLNRLAPKAGQASTWSDYMTSNNNYSPEGFEAKQAFVRDAIAAAVSLRPPGEDSLRAHSRSGETGRPRAKDAKEGD